MNSEVIEIIVGAPSCSGQTRHGSWIRAVLEFCARFHSAAWASGRGAQLGFVGIAPAEIRGEEIALARGVIRSSTRRTVPPLAKCAGRRATGDAACGRS